MASSCCKVCGQQLKLLTASHLKRHSMTLQQYRQRFEPKQFEYRVIADFLFERFVSVCYRFVQYDLRLKKCFTITKQKRPTAVTEQNSPAVTKKGRFWGLNKKDLVEHAEGRKAIGVYYPQKVSKIITFDIDANDIGLLNQIYNAVIRLGVPDDSVLCNFSGRKGYHVHIFLNNYLNKDIINKFYEVVLVEVGASKKVVELRGGGMQALKLPLGVHYQTGGYCNVVNEFGEDLPDEQLVDYLQSRGTCDAEIIADAVDINFDPRAAAELAKFERLIDSVTPLESYKRTNEGAIDGVKELLRRGVHSKGGRHNVIFKVALYCKDVKQLSLPDSIAFIQQWVDDTWCKNIVDRELRQDILSTCKSIFSHGLRFSVHAKRVSISLPDLREVFTVKGRDKNEATALRRLYFVLMVHAKAYADDDGIFFMAYSQMTAAGGAAKRDSLKSQLQKLIDKNKLQLVEAGRQLKQAARYKLLQMQTYCVDAPCFQICDRGIKCKDCAIVAACSLSKNPVEDFEIVDADFRQCPDEVNASLYYVTGCKHDKHRCNTRGLHKYSI